jgi:cell division protein ZapA (FtsZ GTPase activity inhibitor)
MAQRPNAADSGEEAPLEAAARRLERALALLDSRVKTLTDRAEGAAGGLFDFDRSNLAAELDAARAREKELEEAGRQASEALDRAIAEIRSALDGAEAD